VKSTAELCAIEPPGHVSVRAREAKLRVGDRLFPA
jgi:hypothetical protein